MRKLVIGVDADGVLTDMSKFNQESGTHFFRKEPVNSNAYSIRGMFNCSKWKEFQYGCIYFPKYCKEYDPREGVVSTLKKLDEEGYPLYSITARKFATFRNIIGFYSRKMFQDWVQKHHLNFKSYEYCSETFSPRDKWIACHKLSVDVMIEDKPDVALTIANNGTKVLLFDAPYNQEITHENIVRVKNWAEIYQQIKIIEKSIQDYSEEGFRVLKYEDREHLSPLQLQQYFINYKRYLMEKSYNQRLNQKYNFNFKLSYMLGFIPMSFSGLKVYGKENVPYQNGLIFASNHLNSYDQFLISKALGNRPLRGLASSTIENTVRGKLFKKSGATFVDRTDSNSKKEAEENLCIGIVNGNDTLIFPEGTRKNKNEEGRRRKILDFKLGTASIAQKTSAPIVPVAIKYVKHFKLIKRPIVSFGEPILVKWTDNVADVTQKLHDDIETLIDQTPNKRKIKKL